MLDEEYDEFLTELGLSNPQTCSIGCQTGDSAVTLGALQHAIDDEPGRAPPRERSLEPGMTALCIKDRVLDELL